MKFKLNNEIINEIKEAALKYYTTDSVNSRNSDNFTARCYIKSTLDYLVRNGILEYTENDKLFPYEPTDE